MSNGRAYHHLQHASLFSITSARSRSGQVTETDPGQKARPDVNRAMFGDPGEFPAASIRFGGFWMHAESTGNKGC